jgi:hypothetical protein
VVLSFFRTSVLLCRWRGLPFGAVLGSEKQEQKRMDGKSQGMDLLGSFPKAFVYTWIVQPPLISEI